MPFAGYYAAVSALDSYVGEMADALRDTGLSKRTMFIFCSDHGETFLYRGGTDHKATCHDDSLRIPLIVWSTDLVPAGRVVGAAAGLQDLMPTILDYAGIVIPSHVQGVSLRPVINGAEDGRKVFYVENTTDTRSDEELAAMFSMRFSGRAHPHAGRVDQRAIWTPEHKLVLSNDGKHLLYDLVNDPEEELDIFGAPRSEPQNRYRHFADQRPVARRLVETLLAEARRYDDAFGVDLAQEALATIGAPERAA